MTGCRMSVPRDLNRWREEIGRNLLRLDFRPVGDSPFRYSIKPVLVGKCLKVVANTHGPGYAFRDKELVRDGDGTISFIYPRRGKLHYAQRRDGALRPGDATILTSDFPGHAGAPHPWNMFAVMIQPGIVPGDVALENLATAVFPRQLPALSLLRSYIDTLDGAAIAPDSELAELASRHILDLVRLAALERSQAGVADFLSSSTIGDARVRIARGRLAKCYRDPNLTEADIARHQGITTRHLQRIFEAAGLKFTELVNTLRLDAAHRALCDRSCAGPTITEIALASGFSDISHFNRLFRRRFGVTPSEVRLGR